jgi:hypothetical protein
LNLRRGSTTHLFFGKYPYKVSVLVPYNARPNRWGLSGEELKKYQRRREEFLTDFIRPGLPSSKTYRLYGTQQNLISIFFINEADAQTFIKGPAKSHIYKYHAPSTPDELAVIQSRDNSTKIRVRYSLFHRAYRWCVIFKFMPLAEADNIRSWAHDVFGSSQDRSYLSGEFSVRLFLSDEADVLIVLLAFQNDISQVEKVILKSEISNEPHAGAPPDREGSDPDGD